MDLFVLTGPPPVPVLPPQAANASSATAESATAGFFIRMVCHPFLDQYRIPSGD
jgi:hypothetical protein